jgi:ribonucleotide monophosphatase NagD (HAD superfamily)
MVEREVLQNRRGNGSIASLMTEDDESQPAITTEGKPLKEFVEAFERMLIDNTMRRHKGSHSECHGRVVLATPDPERKDG